jgi:hypothetical protein
VTGHRPEAGRIRRLRRLLAYTGRRDMIRRLDQAMNSSTMSSEILGELILALEDFRKNDPVRHLEVMDLVGEIITDLKKAWR